MSSYTASSSACIADSRTACVQALVSQAHFARIGYETGVAAALCWLALGLDSIARPQEVDLRDTLWSVPSILTAVTFWFFHLVQRSQAQRLEQVTHRLWQISCGLMLVINIALIASGFSLSACRFPYCSVLWTVTLIAFGIGTWKAAIFPRYVAVAIMLLEPGSILTQLALSPIAPFREQGAYSGAIEKALGMAVVALVLRHTAERLHWECLGIPERKMKRAA